MKVSNFYSFVLTSIFVFAAVAAEDDPKIYAGKSEMSGYNLKNYTGFEKKWHLVTVRYRKDTGEMRYTYANELAWKTLQKGLAQYPDGAVFAKIGLATQEDPAFASSAVPSGARRYQLMVRDQKKHPETGGWGYALFDEKGLTFPGEPHTAAKACAACHQLVPERGQVFSQIAELSPFSVKIKTAAAQAFQDSEKALQNKMKYETVKASEIPPEISKYLPAHTNEVRSLQSSIVKNTFQGTLDEIRPSLANEVLASTLPAILVSEKKDMFSLVFLNPDKTSCTGVDEKAMIGVHSLDLKNDKVYTLNFCHKKSQGPSVKK